MVQKIVVLCSGRLAVPSLHHLAASGLLAGIVAPDTDPQATILLQQLAYSLHCPFYSASRMNLPQLLIEIGRLYQPDVAFVLGFPWRIPAESLTVFPHGFLNFHGGLLPELRGPDPIFEAIRQERTETALTIHQMEAGWDTGPIVYEDRFALPDDTTHGLLGTQIAFRSAQSIPTVLQCLNQNQFSPKPQPIANARYYHRVSPAALYINWSVLSANAITALVRACNPVYGGAATIAGSWTFRILDASIVPHSTHTAQPGMLLALDQVQGAFIQCLDEQVLQIRMIGTDEGYFMAAKLHEFGIRAGTLLTFPTP